jgi:hypothetical protein
MKSKPVRIEHPIPTRPTGYQVLALAVIETALDDLCATKDKRDGRRQHRINDEKVRADALDFIQTDRIEEWAETAHLPINKIREGAQKILDKRIVAKTHNNQWSRQPIKIQSFNDDGPVAVYQSLATAAATIHRSSTNIYQAIVNHGLCAGLHWRRVHA